MTVSVRGYFTVEAALVIPIVLTGIVTVMYLLIFQYDRCLLEQDTGTLALRGSSMQAEDNGKRVELLERQAAQQDGQKYMMYDGREPDIKWEKGVLTIERGGNMGWKNREIKTVYRHHTVSPVFFVRQYQKLMQKKETD